MRFRLGTGIANTLPFHRVPISTENFSVQQPVQQKDNGIITNKVLIIFGIVVIIKIIILLVVM
jgi:hypothetical protein